MYGFWSTYVVDLRLREGLSRSYTNLMTLAVQKCTELKSKVFFFLTIDLLLVCVFPIFVRYSIWTVVLLRHRPTFSTDSSKTVVK